MCVCVQDRTPRSSALLCKLHSPTSVPRRSLRYREERDLLLTYCRPSLCSRVRDETGRQKRPRAPGPIDNRWTRLDAFYEAEYRALDNGSIHSETLQHFCGDHCKCTSRLDTVERLRKVYTHWALGRRPVPPQLKDRITMVRELRSCVRTCFRSQLCRSSLPSPGA